MYIFKNILNAFKFSKNVTQALVAMFKFSLQCLQFFCACLSAYIESICVDIIWALSLYKYI